MTKKSQCPAKEERKKVIDRMLIHQPRFPVNIERSLTINIFTFKILSSKLACFPSFNSCNIILLTNSGLFGTDRLFLREHLVGVEF